MAPTSPRDPNPLWSGVGAAWTMSVELLTATFVWGGVGWVVDTYVLPTSPWLMVAGFVLGFSVGMYLLYLRMQEEGRAEDERRARARRGVPDQPAGEPADRTGLSTR